MAMPFPRVRIDRTFGLLFLVMFTIATGNTALQSVLPALGRSLGASDTVVAGVFSVSALLWMLAAPHWAHRSERQGRRAMVLLGLAGFTVSQLLCGLFLAAGINGLLTPLATFLAFIGGRLLYGAFGSAAPPAVQALVAGRTTPDERVKALTLIASAFGLGTIVGPTIAPYLVFGHLPAWLPRIELSGPPFVFSLMGAGIWIAAARFLPREEATGHGAAVSYPSIGGQATGASVTAATASDSGKIGYFDPRVRPWMVIGLVMGHAQAMTGQVIGFLLIDRLHLAPVDAVHPTGLVLTIAALAALFVQWGVIPQLDLGPRAMVLTGLSLGAAGCIATGSATTLYGIAMGNALASIGFGFARPGFTAGASLAVGPEAQGSVAGRVTSVNGAVFVFGPPIGVGLYELWRPLPYLTAAAWLAIVLVYALLSLRPSDPGRGAFPAQ